jgi:hypothetical protein
MGRRRHFRPDTVVWKMLRLQLQQSNGPLVFRTLAGKFTMTVFALLQCLLLLSLYQTWIVYSLARPKPSAPFASLDELLRQLELGKETLVRRREYSFQLLRSWFYDEMAYSSDKPYQELRTILAKHPPVEVNRSAEVLTYLSKGKYVTVTTEDDRVHFMASTECDIMMVYDDMPMKPTHMVFRKGYPLLERVNDAILEESVNIKRIMTRYDEYSKSHRSRACSMRDGEMKRWRPFGGLRGRDLNL